MLGGKAVRVKKGIPVHPFLFAMLSILVAWAANLGQVHFSEVLVPWGIALGSALALFLLVWLILRNAAKAGIIISVSVLLFSFYGLLLDAVARRAPWLAPTLCVTVFALAVYFTVRTRRKLGNLTTILNVLAACVMVFPLIRIGLYAINRPSFSPEAPLPGLQLHRPDDPPDIYYIVLDSYERSDTLKDMHDYDNSAFIAFLTSRGFCLPSESRSNYCVTNLCLASVLNMEYIDELIDVDPKFSDLGVLTPFIQKNRVLNLLSSVGYTTVHIGGNWSEVTSANPYADISTGTGSLTEFESLLVENSALSAFGIGNTPATYRDQVLTAYDKLAEAVKIKGPKFVFSHIECPHWPFVFGPNGEAIDPVDWRIDTHSEEKYLDQITFTNKKIEYLIDEILSESKTPPIIIIQGDHGARLTSGSEAVRYRDDFDILNALYLPTEDGNATVYGSITAVNTFRVVFDLYFDANMGLLRDENYWSYTFYYPFYLTNMTDKF